MADRIHARVSKAGILSRDHTAFQEQAMRDNSQRSPDITRRTAMGTMTTLASGFALAVRPVSAATISTDSAGLLDGAGD